MAASLRGVTISLEDALAKFADARSGQLSAVIEHLGKEAVAAFQPPVVRTNMAFHRAWLDAATDPRKRSWCVATILDRLPKLIDGEEHGSGDKCEAVVERANALAKLAPDPRIGRAMLDLFVLQAPSTNFVIAQTAMTRAFLAHADDEAAARVIADPKAFPKGFDPKKLPSKVALPADVKRLVAAAPKPRPKADLKALWANVFADPDDDARLAVLSDALQEEGDPRGELIALQLREHRGEASDDDVKQAQELVKAHGKKWLGKIHPIVYRAEMRRGLLAKVDLAGSWATNKIESYLEADELRTVAEIEAGQANGRLHALVLASPLVHRTIRRLSVWSKEVFALFPKAEFPNLRAIETHQLHDDPKGDRFRELLPWIEAHPTIRELGCRLAFVKFCSPALLSRLRALVTGDDLPKALAFWKAQPHLTRLVTGHTHRFELLREGKRQRFRVLELNTHTTVWLKHVPKDVEAIEIVGNDALCKRLTKEHGKKHRFVAKRKPSGAITGVKA